MVWFHADRLEVIVDNSPRGRCPDRGHPDKRLARDVLRPNGAPRSQCVVAWHDDDQRVLSQQPEFQTGRLLFRTQEGEVDLSANETCCEVWRVLAVDDDFRAR